APIAIANTMSRSTRPITAAGLRKYRFTASISALRRDARIEPHIEEIDDEVHDYDKESGDEGDAEQRVEITLDHRFIGEAAKARQGEYTLHHHRAAEHGASLQADQRDHRQQGIAEYVPHEDAGFIQALRPCGTDKVEIEHLEHRGAHDAKINRKKDQPERQ